MLHYLQYLFLKKFYRVNLSTETSTNRISLDKIFSQTFPEQIAGKFVVDFGCGYGEDTRTLANWGAYHALGLEIRPELVEENRKNIQLPNCSFATNLPQTFESKADIIISVNAFEHFDRPDDILNKMFECLRPGGEALISFGPTWYHPYGGHTFSVFPWAHFIFSEKALMKWRNQFYHDGATRFHEVAGGLNKLSIKQFEKIFRQSGFILEDLYCKPIRGWHWLQKILGRERSTSMVLVKLKRPYSLEPELI